MSRPDDDPSVFHEPHLAPDPANLDPSEAKAARALGKEGARRETRAAPADSVFDEPDILPGRASEVISQDWSCSQCGYNLRGLPVGHPCPECGHRELYRPPPVGATSYQAWLQERIGRTRPGIGWTAAIAVAVCGGPLAVLSAFLGTSPGTVASLSVVLLISLYAPAVEETMKIALAAIVVEKRPYWFRRAEQIQVAVLGSALLFAVIENVIYLNVYIPNPGIEIILWRWTICVGMHVGCTMLASRGLIAVWERTMSELRPPRVTDGMRMLVVAIVVHGGYNAAAIGFELAQGSF